MKSVLRLSSLLVLLVGVAQAQGPAPSVEAKVDGLFAAWNKADSPGCAVAVIKDGRMVYKRGFGIANLEQGTPITSETAFYIASTSKQFTAMCIALLAEQGKISLDDNVRKYLPELPQYERPITIRNLIHHTSGLRDYLTLWALAGRDFADSMPEAEAIKMIARQKALNFLPGDEYLYSNSGYFLLSVIVKRASGKSLREFAEANVFKPLGMTHTRFHDDRSAVIPKRADGYTALAGGGFAIVKTSYDLVGDGGLFTTIDDLFLWDQNFYANKLGTRGQALIDQVVTKGRLASGREISYASGLGINEYRGLKTIDHGGAFIGFRAQLLRVPEERFTVIVLGNLESVNPDSLARKIVDVYLADRLQPEQPKAAATPGSAVGGAPPQSGGETPVLSTAARSEYAGEYYSEELDTVYSIVAEERRLVVRIRYAQPRFFGPAGADAFAGLQAKLRFVRGPTGKVSGFVLDAGRVRNLRFERRS